MGLHELKGARGARSQKRRVGRGDSGRRGSTSGRGLKGQKARGSIRPLFEGGQLPLIKRLPYMRGFTNKFRKVYFPINVDRLKAFDADTEITPITLLEAGIVKKPGSLVKILGDGERRKHLFYEAEFDALPFLATRSSDVGERHETVTLVELADRGAADPRGFEPPYRIEPQYEQLGLGLPLAFEAVAYTRRQRKFMQESLLQVWDYRGAAAGLVAGDGGQRHRGQRRRFQRAAEEAVVPLPEDPGAVRLDLAQQQAEEESAIKRSEAVKNLGQGIGQEAAAAGLAEMANGEVA